MENKDKGDQKKQKHISKPISEIIKEGGAQKDNDKTEKDAVLYLARNCREPTAKEIKTYEDAKEKKRQQDHKTMLAAAIQAINNGQA
uniref:Uncharacterized protein n=1 Tax=Ditylenchus dipsaci TaxID=166011 RepID=A0A915CNG9_9BILA